jgi:rod shape-determining protein MreD
MSRAVIYAVIAFFAVVLQVTLVDRLALPGAAVPDLALVIVVTIGLARGPDAGMLTGFLTGLDLDLAPPASHLIGASALVFCLVGYGCGWLGRRLEHSVPRLLAAALIATAAGESMQAAAALISGNPNVTTDSVGRALPTAVLYDAMLCAVALFLVLGARHQPHAVLARLGRIARRAPMVRLGRAARRRPARPAQPSAPGAASVRPDGRSAAAPRRLHVTPGNAQRRARRVASAMTDRHAARARLARSATPRLHLRSSAHKAAHHGRAWPSGRRR